MIFGDNTNIRLFRRPMSYLVVAQTETVFLKKQIKYREKATVLSLGRSGDQPFCCSVLSFSVSAPFCNVSQSVPSYITRPHSRGNAELSVGKSVHIENTTLFRID